MVVQLYQRDDTIFSGGEAASTLYFLVHGSVNLCSQIDLSKVSTGTERKSGRRVSTLSNKSRRMSSLPDNGQRKTATSLGQVITSITEGTIGAYEFFLRDCYSCTAIAAVDATLLEVPFSHFWSLVVEYHLGGDVSPNRPGKSLQRRSCKCVRGNNCVISPYIGSCNRLYKRG